jgi:hypothetical protein
LSFLACTLFPPQHDDGVRPWLSWSRIVVVVCPGYVI